MTLKKILFLFLVFCFALTKAQNNTIYLKVALDTLTHTLTIEQKITYVNNSSQALSNLFLHNWANSFKNNKTPLGKRFIEDYKKEFYFSKKKDRGYTNIFNLKLNDIRAEFKQVKNHSDILEVSLPKSLKPKDSISISSFYSVKMPNAKFTGYGKTKNGYHLRYWYLIPAVFQNDQWQTMSNLNMDDLFQDVANYTIEFEIPNNFNLESNLYQYELKKGLKKSYYLVGKEKKDIIININKIKRFKAFQTKNTQIKTDILDKKTDYQTSRKIIKNQVAFIEEYLGKHPHVELLIDANTARKNSLREIFGLPYWLKPYPENFKWEMRFFQALTSKYIDDVLLLNKRKNYWLNDGLQTFLMMEYLKKKYPDVSVLGKYSKIWGIRKYNLAKLTQTDKYAFIYQFSARNFYDQALTTQSDSLSNFNRKVVSKYKAGLGLRYLQDFVGSAILKKSLREFYNKHKLKITTSKSFATILQSKTSKDLDWFFGDYIKTTKKIDYKIKKVKLTKNKDSLEVTIKNKRNITAPVALYSVKKKEIKSKIWVTDVDSTKTVTIKNGDFNKLALNFEQHYPEYNSLDNFRKKNNNLISKPLQFRFFKDVENPYYNQVFYTPDVRYNYYDGIILGVNFNNKPIIKHNFEISVTPNYATKSNSLTGAFSIGYNDFYENSKKIYKIKYGFSGSNYHYTEDLAYNALIPYFLVQFRRNTLRDVGSKFLIAKLVHIDKEPTFNQPRTEQDHYNIVNLRYIHTKPSIIKDLQYAINAEIGNNFSKISTDIRYREFFDVDKSFEFRFFGGVFLSNKSTGDYFSFGLNRGTDYLFEKDLFGRSEQSGLFSQQFVIADGGFKSFYDQNSFANQYIFSANTSVTLWRWVEFYNDAAVLKSKSYNPRFFYENGIRFNFVPNIFEVYFPIYKNEGLEINKPNYPSKVRFIITTNLDRIYNFIRRGIL